MGFTKVSRTESQVRPKAIRTVKRQFSDGISIDLRVGLIFRSDAELVIEFLERPRKALHSIFESAARVTGSVRFISGHERLPNDALLLTKNHLNLLFSHHYCEDNMSNIPFEKQHLLVNPIEQIEHDIAQGKGVSGDVLLGALEQSAGRQLDDRLRDVIRRFSVSAVKRRGRPTICKGPEDFALEAVDARYPALLRKHEEEAQQRRLLAAAEGTILPSAEPTPSELAYTEILEGMQADFPNQRLPNRFQ